MRNSIFLHKNEVAINATINSSKQISLKIYDHLK